ncbi:MAG TPA: DUF4307 domain-containing protein [Mycobacteriales bacterium]|nr:DUF4307 domain-containing protein [Mycobacteriales bacterium]
MTTSTRRPQGRYDEPRRLPRQVVVLLGVLLGLVVLTAGYAGYRTVVGHSTSATVLGYEVRDDRHVVIRFEVRHDRDEDARCEVVAYGKDHLTVGHHALHLPRSLASPARISATVTTTARAVAIQVTGCAP